jgi:hypoxanthine phosphoribosyltransferase
MSLHEDVSEVLLTADQLHARVRELGAQLSEDYRGREPVLVSVLKGSIVFLADLVRAMEIPLSVDLMEVSSYGSGTETSGQVRILKDLSGSIEGRDVVVVEDIIDTGLTLHYLLRYLAERTPASIRATAGGDRDQLSRLHDSRLLRRGLWARLRRAVPQPAVRRRAATIGLRRRAARGLSRCGKDRGGFDSSCWLGAS